MPKTKSKPVTEEYLENTFKPRFKEELKEELFQTKDEIIKEIRDFREEFDAHQYSHIRINEEIEDQEKRIKKFENAKS